MTLIATAPRYPQRIVCTTEETVETLYRIGAGELVVGVSGFVVRPPEARKKPRVSTFLAADYDEITALLPDLVLAFSDLQADMAKELALRGIPVYVFNQRSVSEILQSIRVIGALVGRAGQSEALADELSAGLTRIAKRAKELPRRPRVFFEEWPDPLISGIRWCSELVELAGGDDIFKDRRKEQGAKGRIVTSEQVIAKDPEVLIASWCGKKVSRQKIIERPGWQGIAAVRSDQLYEVKSALILQPGPAALSDGVLQLARIIEAVALGKRLPQKRAGDMRGA